MSSVDDETRLNESLLEAMAEAALGGHTLGSWRTVESGYEARCADCGMTTWVGRDGLRYSLLEGACQQQGTCRYVSEE